MRYGSAVSVSEVEILDQEQVMRDALRRESVEVLSHQLDVERREQASYSRAETAVSVLLLGTVLGLMLMPPRR